MLVILGTTVLLLSLCLSRLEHWRRTERLEQMAGNGSIAEYSRQGASIDAQNVAMAAFHLIPPDNSVRNDQYPPESWNTEARESIERGMLIDLWEREKRLEQAKLNPTHLDSP